MNIREMFSRVTGSPKHNHYLDFGYPENLSFKDFRKMYNRNSLAYAAVEKTVGKCWEEFPYILEKARDGSTAGTSETSAEKLLREHLDKIGFWRAVAEVDRRGLVGRYSALVLTLGDGEALDKPVVKKLSLNALIKVTPIWECQIDENLDAVTGKVKSYAITDDAGQAKKSYTVHPDRIIIWSDDGDLYGGQSLLEPGYNDLLTIEKVMGAGGEGFWKNAKSAPTINVDPNADMKEMLRLSGVEKIEDFYKKFSDQIERYNSGFDKLLLLQGMEAKSLNVSLPQPGEFVNWPMNAFAASVGIPVKILIGMQTGERASLEDAREWALTNTSRRNKVLTPRLLAVVAHLQRIGIVTMFTNPVIDWSDLTAATIETRIAQAKSLSEISNAFTMDEIREIVGYEPNDAAWDSRSVQIVIDAWVKEAITTDEMRQALVACGVASQTIVQFQRWRANETESAGNAPFNDVTSPIEPELPDDE